MRGFERACFGARRSKRSPPGRSLPAGSGRAARPTILGRAILGETATPWRHPSASRSRGSALDHGSTPFEEAGFQPSRMSAIRVRLEGLSGTAMTAAKARQRMERFLQAGDAAGERAFWVRICASMWDVSVFRKLEKGSVTGCAYEKGSPISAPCREIKRHRPKSSLGCC
jgi:hypothetical protein